MFDVNKLRQQLSDHHSHKKTNKRLIVMVSAAVFLLLVLIAGTILIFFETNYLDRFYPGSKIGDLNLSGLTKEQAFKLIEERTSQLDSEAVKISYDDGGYDKILLLEEILNPD